MIPQEMHMWCIALKTENTNTLQDTKRQINQSIQDAVLKVTIKTKKQKQKTNKKRKNPSHQIHNINIIIHNPVRLVINQTDGPG